MFKSADTSFKLKQYLQINSMPKKALQLHSVNKDICLFYHINSTVSAVKRLQQTSAHICWKFCSWIVDGYNLEVTRLIICTANDRVICASDVTQLSQYACNDDKKTRCGCGHCRYYHFLP